MFWVDGGDQEKDIPPCIERAVMDGSKRQTIVKTDLGQPRSITIDNYSGVGAKIYWTDSSKGTIESCLYHGSDRTTVVGTYFTCIYIQASAVIYIYIYIQRIEIKTKLV